QSDPAALGAAPACRAAKPGNTTAAAAGKHTQQQPRHLLWPAGGGGPAAGLLENAGTPAPGSAAGSGPGWLRPDLVCPTGAHAGRAGAHLRLHGAFDLPRTWL